jgi:ubiquinone/menaquinone biosynthesis C-methylase UbiE
MLLESDRADSMLDSPIGAERLQAIYDRTAAFYDALVAADQVKAKTRALELLQRRPEERLLEVGVGTGWLFERVVSASGREGVFGLDVAPGMLAVARERLFRDAGLSRPPLLLADARRLPFRPHSFDCLLSTHTLEVMSAEDIGLTLLELRRVLRPGGRLVCLNLTPGEGEDAATTEEWQRRFAGDPEYFGGARPVLLASSLARAGFSSIERHYSGRGGGWPSEVLLAYRGNR